MAKLNSNFKNARMYKYKCMGGWRHLNCLWRITILVASLNKLSHKCMHESTQYVLLNWRIYFNEYVPDNRLGMPSTSPVSLRYDITYPRRHLSFVYLVEEIYHVRTDSNSLMLLTCVCQQAVLLDEWWHKDWLNIKGNNGLCCLLNLPSCLSILTCCNLHAACGNLHVCIACKFLVQLPSNTHVTHSRV